MPGAHAKLTSAFSNTVTKRYHNVKVVSDILTAKASFALDYWSSVYGDITQLGESYTYRVAFRKNGSVYVFKSRNLRSRKGDPAVLALFGVDNNAKSTLDMVRSSTHHIFVPVALLHSCVVPKYYAYCVTFGESLRVMYDSNDIHPSFNSFDKGYVGVTKRQPLVRFAEHQKDVKNLSLIHI